MLWASRWKRWSLVVLVSGALALTGCSDSSDDGGNDGNGGNTPTDSETGSSAAGSVQAALATALTGGSTSAGLTAASPIPQAVRAQLKALPSVGPLGLAFGGSELSDSGTVTLAFEDGPYECAGGGTVGATGEVTYTYAYDTDVEPAYYTDEFFTSEPLELTLDGCSDTLWTLDGDVTYDVDEYLYIDVAEDLSGSVDYQYDDAFDADITGTEESSGDEATLEMSYTLTGALVGTYDSSGNFTYTTYEWAFDLEINGESYSCTLDEPDADATCE